MEQFELHSYHYEKAYDQKKPIVPLTKKQLAAIPQEVKHRAVLEHICTHNFSIFDGRCRY